MKVPTWVVLGIGALAAFALIESAPLRSDLCTRPGARCGTQPDWYTGEESVTALHDVGVLGRGAQLLYDYSALWAVAAAVLVWAVVRRSWTTFGAAASFGLAVWPWPAHSAFVLVLAAAVAVLHEHRHRFGRDQANG